MNLIKYILMNTAAEGSQGSGGTNAPPPPSPAQSAPSEAPGSSSLDFYAAPAPPPPPASDAPPAPAGESQPPAPPAQSEKPSGSLGYGVEEPSTPPAPPAAPAPAAAEQPPAPPAAAEGETPAEDIYKDLVVEGFKPEESSAIIDFAKANNLTKEAAQNFLNLKKAEIKIAQDKMTAAKTKYENDVKAQRQTWANNLKTAWGNEHDSNLHIVEKYVGEFMPETKKWLTDNKIMLPDVVMKDFLGRAKDAYLTPGLPPSGTGDSVNDDGSYNSLSFYDKK